MGRRSVIFFMAEGSIGETILTEGGNNSMPFRQTFGGALFSRKSAKVPERLANGMSDR
jgi:hypothetical protein